MCWWLRARERRWDPEPAARELLKKVVLGGRVALEIRLGTTNRRSVPLGSSRTRRGPLARSWTGSSAMSWPLELLSFPRGTAEEGEACRVQVNVGCRFRRTLGVTGGPA